jgi:SAM-dependent methyltransferase
MTLNAAGGEQRPTARRGLPRDPVSGILVFVGELVADPSNAGMVGAWDGKEGAFFAAHAERVDQSLESSHLLFLEAAAVQADERVLDVGCGTGNTTRGCARSAVNGSALGVDLSSQMLALARRTAAVEGLTNIEFRHADAQIHPFDAAGFDVVVSRLGSMFFGDPVAAFTNLRRALRPSGRLTLLTWQDIADNEWLTAFRRALADGRDLPAPASDAPSPFALSDPKRVSAILDAAGFTGVSFKGLHEPMCFGSTTEEAFDYVSEHMGWMLEGLDDDGRTRAIDALRTSIAAHTEDGGVFYASATWIIQARAV